MIPRGRRRATRWLTALAALGTGSVGMGVGMGVVAALSASWYGPVATGLAVALPLLAALGLFAAPALAALVGLRRDAARRGLPMALWPTVTWLALSAVWLALGAYLQVRLHDLSVPVLRVPLVLAHLAVPLVVAIGALVVPHGWVRGLLDLPPLPPVRLLPSVADDAVPRVDTVDVAAGAPPPRAHLVPGTEHLTVQVRWALREVDDAGWIGVFGGLGLSLALTVLGIAMGVGPFDPSVSGHEWWALLGLPVMLGSIGLLLARLAGPRVRIALEPGGVRLLGALGWGSDVRIPWPHVAEAAPVDVGGAVRLRLWLHPHPDLPRLPRDDRGLDFIDVGRGTPAEVLAWLGAEIERHRHADSRPALDPTEVTRLLARSAD